MRTSGTDVLGDNPSQNLISKKLQNHRRGHYCWSCGKTRANEKFFGRNHAEYLCKECAQLGKEEQALMDVTNINCVSAFTTKDGSEIRELLSRQPDLTYIWTGIGLCRLASPAPGAKIIRPAWN